jgi:SAM-dependent methyltransferase
MIKKYRSADQSTAQAFASSWNNLPPGSIYTWEQFTDWLAPLAADDIAGKTVLELGCGNGSLLIHLAKWNPAQIEAVDLGDSVRTATANIARQGITNCHITQADLTSFQSAGFDVVYSIGVLHHLKNPARGFDAVVRNTRSGGRFHCWVYAFEGNTLVRWLVDPLRRLASRLPWWFTKYCVAAPLAVPFFLYAKMITTLRPIALFRAFPLADYCRWISGREFAFFRHVAFDQLVTPQTTYLRRREIETWLACHAEIDPGSIYIIMRNGNSWKFGGRVVERTS